MRTSLALAARAANSILCRAEVEAQLSHEKIRSAKPSPYTSPTAPTRAPARLLEGMGLNGNSPPKLQQVTALAPHIRVGR